MELNTIPMTALPLVDTQLSAAVRARRREGTDPAQARKVAGEFEAMFVGMMLKSMRATVGKDELTGGGRGEETFRSLLDQEYAAAASRNGGLGLAKMIEKELTRTVGATPSLKGSGDAD